LQAKDGFLIKPVITIVYDAVIHFGYVSAETLDENI
jgi:hypothetical protein